MSGRRQTNNKQSIVSPIYPVHTAAGVTAIDAREWQLQQQNVKSDV